ncbi:AMP-binding protein [Photorhabdus laumondii]
MKLRKANSYEQFQWLRYRRNHNDLGLTLSYQFKLVGKVDFERLNHVLRMVLSHQFYFLLSYFLERNNSLFVGMNVLPDIVLEQVYDEVIWNSHEPINPAGDRLFKFTYFIKETEVVLLKLEFSHLVFDGECYKPFINVLSKYWCNEPTQQRRSEMVILEEVQPDATSIIFWRKSLKGVRLFQPLSFCYKIPKDVGAYLSVKRTLGGVEFATIHELLERRHVTLFQFIVAVTSALISRYKNREEGGERVVIAHTVSCRREGLPYGCYTNLIPLFVNVDCAQPGSRLFEEVRLSREVVCAHQYTPTLKLIEMADARANHGGRLFNLTVNNSDGLIPYETPVLAGLEVDWVGKPETGGPNDLAVNYSCDGEKLYISFDSSSRYMSHEVLTALGENFVRMAQFMALSPDVPLFSCDLSRPLAPIICGNQNLAAFDGNVLARVTAAVIRHGDEPAVSDERMTLTYQEMLHVVQAIRSKITACSQIESTRSVGIFLGRSAALPIAHLSALAALRTFVPMDPLLPNERLKYMVAAADVCMLLVDQSTKQRAAVLFPGMANIDVDEVLAEPSTFSHNLSLTPKLSEAGSSQSEHAAYILFTSGSTGRPKGVAISERNLMNFLYSMENTPGFRACLLIRSPNQPI